MEINYMSLEIYGTNSSGGERYFEHTRSEIRPLLPASAKRILEVGCGSGSTLRWLRTLYGEVHLTGIDGFAPNLKNIQASADVAIICDLNDPLSLVGKFDLILALDVLEHLRDADFFLKTVCDNYLLPGGTVIISVPAVSHFSVSLPLLFRRQFSYTDAGILDRTHLRFFVESTSVELMNNAGMSVTQGLLGGLSGRKVRLFNSLTFGTLKHWLTKQYILSGIAENMRQKQINWIVAKYGKIER